MTEESTENNSSIEVDMGDRTLSFSAGRSSPQALDGFNEHGVRENRDGDGNLTSIDVVYEAMEPGPPEDRNGVRITENFLQTVANKEYSKTEPYMLGHSKKPLDEVGKMKEVWFSDVANKLMVMNRVFNTGAATHDEVISRLTHTPPTMTDGSVGLGNNYEAVVNDNDEPELVDGKIREFSTVPFPGGYDDGGVGLPSSDFADSVLENAEQDFDEHSGDSEEKAQVYEMWEEMTNMTEEQMEMWEEHPCSDKGVDVSEQHRDNFMMLMGQPIEGWGMEEVQIANRAVDYIADSMEMDPENPESGGEGTCPSRWAVNLLNRGMNPFDSFPTGNPQFNHAVEVISFDDEADGDLSSENSDLATTQTIKF